MYEIKEVNHNNKDFIRLCEKIDYAKPSVPGHVLKHVNSLRTSRQIDCPVL